MKSLLSRGKPIADEDRAWLTAYAVEHPKMAPDYVPPAKAIEPKASPAPGADVAGSSSPPDDARGADETAGAAPLPPPAATPKPPRAAIPKAPRAEPPPRIADDELGARRATATDWRAKYKVRVVDENGKPIDMANGRELICVEIAGAWHKLNAALDSLIVAVDKKPLVPADALRGTLVLAVDDLLPKNFSIEPAHLALAGTTALGVQCLLNYKGIRAALKAQEEAAAHDTKLDEMKKRTREAEAKFQAEEAQRRAADAERRAKVAAVDEDRRREQHEQAPVPDPETNGVDHDIDIDAIDTMPPVHDADGNLTVLL